MQRLIRPALLTARGRNRLKSDATGECVVVVGAGVVDDSGVVGCVRHDVACTVLLQHARAMWLRDDGLKPERCPVRAVVKKDGGCCEVVMGGVLWGDPKRSQAGGGSGARGAGSSASVSGGPAAAKAAP